MSTRFRRGAGKVLLALAFFVPGCVGQAALGGPAAFAPLEQWRSAVRSGDSAALRALYSTVPPATIGTPQGQVNTDSEIAFWTGLNAHSVKLDIVQSTSPQSDVQQIVLQVEIHPSAPQAKTVYVAIGQLWQRQGGEWRLVAAKRGDAAHLQQPTSTEKQIYAPGVDARVEIKHALREAAAGHKRVLVVFGANWCYDCHVLDLAFHRPDLAPLLARGYEVVHVDVGRYDKNQDLVSQYQVAIKRGIPAIAVLDSNGRLLFSQREGEFENARAMAPEDLLQFLNKWKPQAR